MTYSGDLGTADGRRTSYMVQLLFLTPASVITLLPSIMLLQQRKARHTTNNRPIFVTVLHLYPLPLLCVLTTLQMYPNSIH